LDIRPKKQFAPDDNIHKQNAGNDSFVRSADIDGCRSVAQFSRALRALSHSAPIRGIVERHSGLAEGNAEVPTARSES